MSYIICKVWVRIIESNVLDGIWAHLGLLRWVSSALAWRDRILEYLLKCRPVHAGLSQNLTFADFFS